LQLKEKYLLFADQETILHLHEGFLVTPRPIPKMRGGIFIPVNVAELSSQWKFYDPRPLLIVYSGINHYASTTFIR